MRDPNKYLQGLETKNQLLSSKNDEMIELVKQHAKAEYDYNVAFAEKVLILKTDNHPATLIPKLAAGDRVVADLKMKMVIAEGILNANQNSCKDLRSSIDTYRSILTWMREEKRG